MDSMGMSLSKLQKIVKDREAWRATVHGVTKTWTQLSNWARIDYVNNTAHCELKRCLYLWKVIYTVATY